MIAMSHYLAMDVETVSYLRGRLEDALELECADYRCEGTGIMAQTPKTGHIRHLGATPCLARNARRERLLPDQDSRT